MADRWCLVRCVACGQTDHAPVDRLGTCVRCSGARLPVAAAVNPEDDIPPEPEL